MADGPVVDDPLVDDRPAECWLGAFPWLAATGGDVSEDDAWWGEAIDAVGSPRRAERLAWLAELAIERLGRWTIGEAFPGLHPDTPLTLLDLGTRGRNGLTRAGVYLAADLFTWTLDDLLDMRNFGLGTVDRILRALADASTESPTPMILLPTTADSRRHRAKDAHKDRLVPWGEWFVEDLRLLARWHAALGTPATALLEGETRIGTPPEVIKARQRLFAISAGDVLNEHEISLDAASLIEQCFGALNERAQQILARRLFANEHETLDELGASLGVTRERIRQIEANALAKMVCFLEPGGALELIGASVREVVETILPLDDLLALVPPLARTVEAVGQPAWRVLDRFDDHYEIEDGWCVAPSMDGAQAATSAQLQELANQYGVVRIDELEPLSHFLTDAAGAQRAWLEYCGYVLDGEYVFTRTQSLGDRAAAVLSVEATPLSAQGVLDRIGIERTLGSLKNAMSSDDRFERVDRDRWALAEWGMESYVGIQGLIKQELARSSGKIQLETLIETITGKYSLGASSVVSYASAAPFETRDGVVRVALKDRSIRKTPKQTRRLYRRAGCWLYRVQVTKEHLRGSGSVAPVALAGVLGLVHGETRHLDCKLGPQTISWVGNQPTIGSIRRFLLAEDVELGSEVFLVLYDSGSFGVEVVASVELTEQLSRALVLAGVPDPAEVADPRIALAQAIEIGDDTPIVSIIGAYRDRGDEDISDLLLTARDRLTDPITRPILPSAEIKEILALL
jgi:hypothetical protein